FEVEAGREAEVGVGRPREAVDAAVLAAAIRVDRAVEADIGRLVAGDDFAARVDADAGRKRRQVFKTLPAVVEGNARKRLVSARRIRLRAAATPTLAVHQ